jgi:hypothetical protein
MARKGLVLGATLATVGACSAPEQSPSAGPVSFRAHDIAEIRGGYAVAVADFDGDGLLDVIANALAVPQVAWHRNPTWERHVIVDDKPGIVNQAMADLNGDGIPEVAFQSAFAMQAANSEGLNWIARSQGDPTSGWEADRAREPGADVRPGQRVRVLVRAGGLEAARHRRRSARNHP